MRQNWRYSYASWHRTAYVLTCCAIILTSLPVFAETSAPTEGPPVYERWQHYGIADGLPSNKIMSVATDSTLGRVWVGTDRGLALMEDGVVERVYTTDDGLAHRAVIALDVDERTHEVWAGTMGGLNRIGAGRIDTYTQFNSGLANDVVFGVAVENQNVWFATTAGTGRFHIRDNTWEVFTPENSPQHEPWGYFVEYNPGDSLVYAALWGGGLLEYDLTHRTWKPYLDPDGEMEIDLLRDDGIVHVITTGVAARNGVVWVSTYFGLSSYDHKSWRAYMDHDTGLASNFINFVKAKGRVAYACTDKGLSAIDYDSNRWVTYAPDTSGSYTAQLFHENELLEVRQLEAGLSNNFVWACDFLGDDIWVATARGLSRGIWTESGSSSKEAAQ
jgi:ligand-binding sensor domain-containing protein